MKKSDKKKLLEILTHYEGGGIKMSRLKYKGVWSDTYEHKIVYDFEEAGVLNSEGWFFDEYNHVSMNIGLRCYRVLRTMLEEEK